MPLIMQPKVFNLSIELSAKMLKVKKAIAKKASEAAA